MVCFVSIIIIIITHGTCKRQICQTNLDASHRRHVYYCGTVNNTSYILYPCLVFKHKSSNRTVKCTIRVYSHCNKLKLINEPSSGKHTNLHIEMLRTIQGLHITLSTKVNRTEYDLIRVSSHHREY